MPLVLWAPERAEKRQQPEWLYRCVSQPAIAKQYQSPIPNGNIRSSQKKPYRDGTTQLTLGTLVFIARMTMLVPKQRVNLTLFYYVLAPIGEHRILVVGEF